MCAPSGCPTVFNYNRKHVEWPTHCIDHLQLYAFLGRVVVEDESWCHHFELESKRQSFQWKHPGEPPPKKSKVIHTSEGRVILTFFFDQHGPLLIDFLQRETTMNAQRYSQTLTTLPQAIKSKRPGKLTRGVILLDDNARPHTVNTITALLQKFKLEVLGTLYTVQTSLSAMTPFLVTSKKL